MVRLLNKSLLFSVHLDGVPIKHIAVVLGNLDIVHITTWLLFSVTYIVCLLYKWLSFSVHVDGVSTKDVVFA